MWGQLIDILATLRLCVRPSSHSVYCCLILLSRHPGPLFGSSRPGHSSAIYQDEAPDLAGIGAHRFACREMLFDRPHS
jgi:hypothetical protein